jgi:hypothetical protein
MHLRLRKKGVGMRYPSECTIIPTKFALELPNNADRDGSITSTPIKSGELGAPQRITLYSSISSKTVNTGAKLFLSSATPELNI